MSSPEKHSERRRDVLVLAAIAAGLALLFADIVFFGNGFFFRDIWTYGYPHKWVVRESLLSGEFPYWNPMYSAGEPLAANPAYELFYPFQWVILLPHFHFAVQFQILLHLFIGIAGTYILLRVLGLRSSASAAGCFVFGFSGLFLSLVNLQWILFAFAWTPWILACLHLLVTRRQPIWFAAAALVIALQILVGEPMTLMQTVMLMGGYLVYRGWRRYGTPDFLRETLLLAAAGVAGVTISAAQLIPAFDLFPDTIRAQGFSYERSTSWSMPLARPVEFLYPSAWGSVGTERGLYWGSALYPGRTRPVLLSIYAGLLFAILTIAGVMVRLRGSMLLLLSVAICYAVAIGSNGRIYEWLHRAGLFFTFRHPERFIVPVLLAMVVFAAFAFQRILDGDQRLIRAAALVALLVTAVAVISALWTYRGDYLARFRHRWGLPDIPRAEEMAQLNRREWWIASFRGGAAAALLLWRIRGRRKAWEAAAWMYMIADLGLFSGRLLPRMPRKFFTAPDIVRQLPGGRDQYRLFHIAAVQNDAEAARYAGLNAGTFWVVRNGVIPFTGALWGFRTVYEITVDATRLRWADELNELLPQASQRRPHDWADRVSAFSNVRFQVYYRPFDAALARAGGDLETLRPVRFVESPSYPRYYFADRLVRIRDGEDFLREITAPGYTYRTAGIFSEPFAPAGGRVLQVHETNNRASLEVETAGPAYLVASNTFHKYWTATVDGMSVPVERANLAYQGLRIGPGRHRVTFEYRNPLVIPSMVVSVVAVLAVAAMPIILAKRRRRPVV